MLIFFPVSARRHRWHVQACCAHTGEGLVEGFTWLADAVKKIRRESKRMGSSFY